MTRLLLVLLIACGSSEDLEAERRALREERAALAVQRDSLDKERRDLREEKERIAAARVQGLEITLPTGATQDLDPQRKSLVVEIAEDGKLVVAGKPLDLAALENVFRVAYTRDKQMQVIFRADKGASHARVVELMELAKRSGLTHLALGTTRP